MDMTLLASFFGKLTQLTRPVSFAAALALVISCLVSAAYADQVIDEDTGKPLEGVFVMVSWRSDGPSIAISRTVCYAFETLVTDKNGQYTMPKFSWNFNPLLWERRRSVEFYLAGYERSPNDFHDSDVGLMRRFKGTAEERLKKLISVSYREACVSEREARNHLAPVYKAQFEEAKSIAMTPAEKKIAESLRISQILAEVGHEAFTKMLMDGRIR